MRAVLSRDNDVADANGLWESEVPAGAPVSGVVRPGETQGPNLSMRDKPTKSGVPASVGVMTIIIAAFALAGCSSVAEMPYPKLSEIVPASGPSLSKDERAAMIEDLKKEQQTHKIEATKTIETR